MVKHISIKKTLALIAAFLLVMVTMASGVSAKTSDISSTNTELSFSLELSPTRVRKGETFYAIVKVDNRTSNPVSNASFSIRYNSEHVTFAGLSNGNSCYAVSEKRQVSGSTYEITATFTATDFATSLKANTESTCDIRFAFTCAQGYSSDQTSPMTLENVSAHCRENIVSSGSAKYTFDSSRIVAGSANVTLASLS